jgi:hypothetical protein
VSGGTVYSRCDFPLVSEGRVFLCGALIGDDYHGPIEEWCMNPELHHVYHPSPFLSPAPKES